MTPLVSTFMSSWPTLGIGLLVLVIVLSYQIEKRSPDLLNRTGVPRWAMLFHTITNHKVARDAPTQRLRKLMLLLLVAIVALFVLVAFAVSTIERPA